MELLAARGISKFFPSTSVLANDGISIGVEAGEILALVGENGAGKSTFARVVAGILAPDSGEVSVRGRKLRPGSVRSAESAGVGLVPQHSFLAEGLSLAEALCLGREHLRGGIFLDRARARAETAELGDRYGLRLDPDALVGSLSPAERRHAEILRVLAWGGDLLLLDEPTSLLTEGETEVLFDLARKLASRGKALVFITHRVAELRAIATRIAVLREGRLVADRPADSFGEGELAELMSRRIPAGSLPAAQAGAATGTEPAIPPASLSVCRDEGAEPRAEARDLVLASARSDRPLSFSVCPGECLGIIALAGNGLDELEAVAAGLEPPRSGGFLVGGRPIGELARSRLRAEGMGYVPSDREGRGIAIDASVSDNLNVLDRAGLRFRDWILPGRREERGRDIARTLGPRSAMARAAYTLSGGNRQRLLLSRELSAHRPFLLLADPSQGLDLEGREALALLLEEERRRGAGILLLSSSTEELTRLADRVAVLYRGSIAWEGDNRGPSMARELTAHLTGIASAPPGQAWEKEGAR